MGGLLSPIFIMLYLINYGNLRRPFEEYILNIMHQLNIVESEVDIEIKRDHNSTVPDTKIDNDFISVTIPTGLDLKEELISIAHEMVHVKQIVNKEFDPIHPIRWMGVTKFQGEPWETEAYDLENKLFNSYFCNEDKINEFI